MRTRIIGIIAALTLGGAGVLVLIGQTGTVLTNRGKRLGEPVGELRRVVPSTARAGPGATASAMPTGVLPPELARLSRLQSELTVAVTFILQVRLSWQNVV